MTSSTFTIQPYELDQWLAPAIELAGRDDMIPVLTAILLDGNDRVLTSTATDRYRAGITRHCIPEEQGGIEFAPVSEPFHVLLPAGAARALLSTFKPRARRAPKETVLTVVVDTDAETMVGAGILTVSGMTYAGHRATVEFDLMQGEYPKVARLVRDAITRPYGDARPAVVGVNPELIAGFRKAVRDVRSETLVIHPGVLPKDAIGFTAGDYFAGCLMPRRELNARGTAYDSVPDFGDVRAWVSDLIEEKTEDAA